MAAEKPKYSLSKLAKRLEKIRHQQNRVFNLMEKHNDQRFSEELGSLELKLIHFINKTELPEGVPSALAYAVCEIMNCGSENSKTKDYLLPTGVAYRTVRDFAKSIYKTRINFLVAPLSIECRIQNPNLRGPMMVDTGVLELGAVLDDNMLADTTSATDYALMQKLFANLVANAEMHPKEYVEKFGRLSCDNNNLEMVQLHRDFANAVWNQKPNPNFKLEKVMDMPGSPVSRVEVYRLKDIVGKK